MLFDDALTFESFSDLEWAAPSTDNHGCPCCSPVFSFIGTMAFKEELASVEFWKSKNRVNGPVRNAVLVNAKVLTMDANHSVFEALAIKDGKVIACGSREEVALVADAEADIIDCKGRVILPGFIEPHMHFLPIASIGRFEDIGPYRFTKTVDAIGHLKKLAENLAQGQWLMARQFDPSLQEGPEFLTADMLDEVSTHHPVFVYNASLHFAYCNSVALQMAGIDRDTPDDPASPYGRWQNGEPNGVLKGGGAMSSVVRFNEGQKDYDLGGATLDICERANRLGITTFCDQATGSVQGVKEIDLYNALAASGSMTARLRYSLSYRLQEKWDSLGIQCDSGSDMARVVGWKIVSDGSNQGFTGLQREPYLHRQDAGLAYVAAEELTEMVMDRASRGWALVIHANGDKAIDNTLDAYEAAAESGLLTNLPCRIEHCSILHDEQIDRMAALGISPSFLIGHVYYWGHAMRDRVFGEVKANLLDRTAACEAKGIRWTLHSDEPVTEMGPLRCIQNAVTRDLWKEPGTKLAEQEAVSVDAALRAMTIDAAWQCHSDHEVGSLEPGKFADFVILESDPRDVLAPDISKIKVLETWLAGRQVFASSQPSTT